METMAVSIDSSNQKLQKQSQAAAAAAAAVSTHSVTSQIVSSLKSEQILKETEHQKNNLLICFVLNFILI